MERYFPKVARASTSSTAKTEKHRYHPYKSQSREPDQELNDASRMLIIEHLTNTNIVTKDIYEVQRPKHEYSLKKLNQALLRNLSSEYNPITHSDAADRAGYSFFFIVLYCSIMSFKI